MFEVIEKEFYEWSDRMYEEAVKVTGITKEIVEYLYYRDIGCFRKAPERLHFFNDGLFEETDTCRKGNYIITFCTDGRSTFKIINLKNGKSGWSKMPYFAPEFDGKVALAVAYARYCKNEVPKVKKNLKTIISFTNIEPGTELYCRTKSNFKTVKFIAVDPDEPSNIILKVTYKDGVTKLITWYNNCGMQGCFYKKED